MSNLLSALIGSRAKAVGFWIGLDERPHWYFKVDDPVIERLMGGIDQFDQNFVRARR